MHALRHTQFTEEDYLREERIAGGKSEFYRGHMIAMAGGSFRHNRLCAELIYVFGKHLRGRPWRPSSSDQRLMTPDRLYTYPDLAVYCGKIVVRPGTSDVATNPTVLVEVLSDSTREYDLGDKLDQYKQIPTLKYVLLFEPDEAQATVWSREGEAWVHSEVRGLAADISLSALDITLPMAEIYEGVVGPEGPLAV